MNTPFTIFHLDGEPGFRGGERQLIYLAAALRERGHRNVVVCKNASGVSLESGRLGLERLHLPFLGEWDLWTALRIRAAARSAPRPLLHAHTAHAAAMAALASGGVLPWVVHRRVDFPLNGGLSRRFKYESAGAVVGVSKAVAEVLKGSGLTRGVDVVYDGVPSDPEECRWAGIASDRYAPASPEERTRLRAELSGRWGFSADSRWIGNLAALVPHKDHDTLLAAALLVLKRRPEAVFLIAGEGPEEAALIGQIKRLGLRGKAFILGRLPDPSPLLKSLDILAHSSWGEGMGSVLLEASAAGLPIAATSAGGIPEVVADGATGLLCPPRNPEALAANILRLLDDPALGARLGKAARAALPRWGLRRMAQDLEAVYERAAGKAR